MTPPPEPSLLPAEQADVSAGMALSPAASTVLAEENASTGIAPQPGLLSGEDVDGFATSIDADPDGGPFARAAARRREQVVLAAICVILLIWATVRWVELSRWGQAELELLRQPEREYEYVLDPNTANWIEWALLDGVGEVLGKRIVADREARGPFRSIDDLRRVKGIGPKTLDKLRPHLQLDAQGL